MTTMYDQTDNYALNLYGDNDPADLRDGYNGSMRTIDETLKNHLDRIDDVKTSTSTTLKAQDGKIAANTDILSKLGATDATAAETKKAQWDGAAAQADSSLRLLGGMGVTDTDSATAFKGRVAANEANITHDDEVLKAAFGDNTVTAAQAKASTWDAKASTDYAYAKAETYTKPQIESLIAASHERSAYGNPTAWKHVVFLGDSMSKGFYSGTEHPASALPYLVDQIFGWDAMENKAVSGSGYDVSTNFRVQWDQVSDKSSVDAVFVIGGVNDNNNDVWSSAKALYDTIATQAPKARIIVLPILGGVGLGLQDHSKCLESIRQAALANRHVIVVDGVHRWGTYLDGSNADGYIHVTAEGYAVYANIIAQMLFSQRTEMWPTRTKTCSQAPITGDPIWKSFDSTITESNGIIQFRLHAQSGRSIDAGVGVVDTSTIPWWAGGNAQEKWLPTGINSKYVLVGPNKISLQFGSLATDQWIIGDWSWMAGM
nr:MAG TPA: hydrolase [Caudoviricetes sp.]